MKLDISIQNIGNLSLTDKNYVGAGGEATVYKKDKLAIKIYHEKNKIINPNKIAELASIQGKNVLKPLYNVYDQKTQEMLGYAMEFINNTEPLCRLFTKTFKVDNNISETILLDLIKYMQKTISSIHKANCLIVDMNEMNILVTQDFITPVFIDVDSYQTKSFKATAIMENIRDHSISNNNFSELSDWYSFAILIFQMYIGIHPYKGKHPKYKANEWSKRMSEGVSVFDKDVTLPSVCNDFSHIPKRQLDWMKELFIHNKRSLPPNLDNVIHNINQQQAIIIQSSEKFDILRHFKLKGHIIQSVYNFMGVNYYVTRTRIFKGSIELESINIPHNKKSLLPFNSTEYILTLLDKNNIAFLYKGKEIDSIIANNFTEKNKKIYTIQNDKLIENSFLNISGKIIHKANPIAMVSENSSKLFDGLVYQDLLGKAWLTIPLETGCINHPIKELDGYKVIDMKIKNNICISTCIKSNIYYRFIIVFNFNNLNSIAYDVRIIDNINYDNINFTVLNNGLCILLTDDNKLEIFKDNSKIKIIDNAPFDSSMELFNIDNNVYFLNKEEVLSIKMK